jgi:hypothetical protein
MKSSGLPENELVCLGLWTRPNLGEAQEEQFPWQAFLAQKKKINISFSMRSHIHRRVIISLCQHDLPLPNAWPLWIGEKTTTDR